MTTTRISIMSATDDPLESVRRAVAFCDDAIAAGGVVVVTGELNINVHFTVEPEPEPDPHLQPGTEA